MLEVDPLDVSHWISRYLYPFARIAGLLMVMPLVGSRMVSQRVRIFLAVAITLAVVPVLPPMPKVDAISLASFIIILQQMLIGIALGFIVEMLTQVYVIAGQLIAMQTGLGIATTVDPSQGASVVVISQWFLFLVSLVFISLNGHLVLIEILIDSFTTFPVSMQGFGAEDFGLIVRWSGWMFSAALVIALPAIAALLVVNLAFGVMTRAAPQLNIFALGFPVTMIVGLFVMWLSVGEMATGFQAQMDTLFEFMKKLTLQ
ncbi:flagellar biosynthetic protein FliR [Bacterioplanoides sp. SCSIO 12839]|uniref:flagellar biosynthetic protein FliR n=1 Tax=Bacterioplanoides sp. SCSIO 12839 TaxID=2829569 RepID=UPI0021077FD6|nr:flagellar biosynthetic protein FliR [Bacterioplanoides sp. SCSIO 12839]UTW48948.1 flagellar type III secretion system protein FliR [Bacterioplanoides sp. SCSIO 12839]